MRLFLSVMLIAAVLVWAWALTTIDTEASEQDYSRAISNLTRQIRSLQDDRKRMQKQIAELRAMPTARAELAAHYAKKRK